MNNSIINWDETLELCNHNQALADELILMLKTDLPRQKQIFLNAYDKQDTRMIRDIVHQILGSCSYISMPLVKKHAQELHDAIHHNENNLSDKKNKLLHAMDQVIMLKTS